MRLTRHKKTIRRPLNRGDENAERLLLLLALIFLTGCLIGSVFCGSSGPTAIFSESTGDSASFWQSLLTFSKFHIAAFLLGSTYYGVALLPLLCFLKGCVLSASAEQLIASRQSGGFAAVLLSMGLPAVISILCFLVLTSDSFKNASRLLSLAKGRPAQAVPYRLLRAALCVPLLLCGNAFSYYLSAKILTLLH